jgi:hypothetical protein
MNSRVVLASALLSLALLTACGGGSDDADTNATADDTLTTAPTTSTTVSSSDNTTGTTPSGALSECPDKTLNGIRITEIKVMGTDCATAEKIASSFEIAKKTFDFAVGDISCFTSTPGDKRGYTCAGPASEIVTFSAQ